MDSDTGDMRGGMSRDISPTNEIMRPVVDQRRGGPMGGSNGSSQGHISPSNVVVLDDDEDDEDDEVTVVRGPYQHVRKHVSDEELFVSIMCFSNFFCCYLFADRATKHCSPC